MAAGNDWIVALAGCIRNSDIDSAERLFQADPGLDVNVEIEGGSLLHLAVKEEQPDSIDFLVSKRANVEIIDNCGNTALHLAAIEGREEMAKKLLLCRANILGQNNNGNTALHLAADKGRDAIARLLLDEGADANVRNADGNTPLHIAVLKNKIKVGKVLLERTGEGNQIWNVQISTENFKGETPESIIKAHKNQQWKTLIECDESLKYDITTAPDEGNTFQLLFNVMLGLRIMSSEHRSDCQNFRLMPELEAAGKLDDIVLRCQTADGRSHSVFIQLKHKNSKQPKENEISYYDLTGNPKNAKNKAFQLSKYFESVKAIKAHELFVGDASQEIILCTTGHFDKKAEACFRCVDSGYFKASLLYFKSDDFRARCFQLSPTADGLKKLRAEWEEKYGLEMVDYFYNNFYFITSYPKVSELNDLISSEISKKFELNVSGLVSAAIEKEVGSHVRTLRGRAITENDIDSFLRNIFLELSVQQCIAFNTEKCSDIAKHGLGFKKELPALRNYILKESSNSHFQIHTKSLLLTGIKVLATLESLFRNKDDFLFIDDEKLQNEAAKKLISTALSDLDAFRVVVFLRSTTSDNDIVELERNSRNSKFVILNTSANISETVYEDQEIGFRDLNSQSQANILEKSLIFLQYRLSFGEVFGKEICDELLDCYALSEILQGSELHIGNGNLSIPPFNSDMVYIPRNLLRQEGDALLRKYGENELSGLETISEGKLILVSGDAGSGKSSLMKSLKAEFEKRNLLALLVNLNECTVDETTPYFLGNINFNQNDVGRAVDFLIKALKPQFDTSFSSALTFKYLKLVLASEELNLWNERLRHVVILLDAVDEISPIYLKQVFVLVSALERSKAGKIWLTTRPHEQEQIFQNLNVFNLILEPFDKSSQMIFLLRWSQKLLDSTVNIVPAEEVETRNKNLLALYNVISSEDRGSENKRRFLELLGMDWEPSWSKDNVLNKNFFDFLSNPLQFRMLIELSFSDKPLSELQLSSIYDNFIERKFAIYFSEKAKQTQTVASLTDCKYLKRELQRQHCDLAYTLLVDFLKPKTGFLKFQSHEELEELSRIGLVSYKYGRFDFVHKSFSEYYLAFYFSENVQFGEMQQFLIRKIFDEKRYEMTCYFLNERLKIKDLNNSSITPLISVKVELSSGKENVIHVAAGRGHIGIIQLLMKVFDSDTFEKWVTHPDGRYRTILDFAAESSLYYEAFEFFEENFNDELFERLLKNSDVYLRNVLESATRSGTFDRLVDFFIKYSDTETLKLKLLERKEALVRKSVDHNSFGNLVDFVNQNFDHDTLKQFLFVEAIRHGTIHEQKAKSEVLAHLQRVFSNDDFREQLLINFKLITTALRQGGFSSLTELYEEFCSPQDISHILNLYFDKRLDFVGPYYILITLEFLKAYLKIEDFDWVFSELYFYGQFYKSRFELAELSSKYCCPNLLRKLLFLTLKALIRGKETLAKCFQCMRKHFSDNVLETVVQTTASDGATLLHSSAISEYGVVTVVSILGEVLPREKFRELVFSTTPRGKVFMQLIFSRMTSFYFHNDFELLVSQLSKLLDEEHFHSLILSKDNNNNKISDYPCGMDKVARALIVLQKYCCESVIKALLPGNWLRDSGVTVLHGAAVVGVFVSVAKLLKGSLSSETFQDLVLSANDTKKTVLHEMFNFEIRRDNWMWIENIVGQLRGKLRQGHFRQLLFNLIQIEKQFSGCFSDKDSPSMLFRLLTRYCDKEVLCELFPAKWTLDGMESKSQKSVLMAEFGVVDNLYHEVMYAAASRWLPNEDPVYDGLFINDLRRFQLSDTEWQAIESTISYLREILSEGDFNDLLLRVDTRGETFLSLACKVVDPINRLLQILRTYCNEDMIEKILAASGV